MKTIFPELLEGGRWMAKVWTGSRVALVFLGFFGNFSVEGKRKTSVYTKLGTRSISNPHSHCHVGPMVNGPC